jgi:hypothetical protein
MKYLNRRLVEGPYFGICFNEKDFHKELKRLGVPVAQWDEWVTNGKNATCHYYNSSKLGRIVIVCFRAEPGLKAAEIYGLLIHEAVHVWQEHKEWIGETNPGREIEAYSIQSISQELIYAYQNRNK